jgi:hypothetical protein
VLLRGLPSLPTSKDPRFLHVAETATTNLELSGRSGNRTAVLGVLSERLIVTGSIDQEIIDQTIEDLRLCPLAELNAIGPDRIGLKLVGTTST